MHACTNYINVYMNVYFIFQTIPQKILITNFNNRFQQLHRQILTNVTLFDFFIYNILYVFTLRNNENQSSLPVFKTDKNRKIISWRQLNLNYQSKIRTKAFRVIFFALPNIQITKIIDNQVLHLPVTPYLIEQLPPTLITPPRFYLRQNFSLQKQRFQEKIQGQKKQLPQGELFERI
eukprot:TRINITY_DN2335_c1_g1_i1.p1 TRINITY_DN2335_c1_g1~~TRINITY_DN2335_c1_g1_i1.p1  ORF type:complete len:177 (-),score=4.81 TRINITY_DN2335_c1_g1_i1:309-839(-)